MPPNWEEIQDDCERILTRGRGPLLADVVAVAASKDDPQGANN